MTSLCDERATIRHVAGDFPRTQRFERSEGHVVSIGRTLWTEMLTSFETLEHRVLWVESDADGNCACSVEMKGVQTRPYAGIPSRGGRMDLPVLYLFKHNDAGKISEIAAYWDGREMRRQLAAVA
ncbi:hypothetical protein [Panacagrimonas perspica]